ncbi:Glucose/arabinose dehydrogenase, beta-propeller fold [Thermostaphylospora chromogena]|uniref:Glucose/arabinose dehydrogenase, beta-propeller fold n=1 Tax=Thermostaphylospora chromogena TaxID=35622 RepID=A0A1H1AG58_9ACTN|nr:Glucose/arabinose dehydrogenase, beta-propeller fold [Thermostaphylospora chromogena]
MSYRSYRNGVTALAVAVALAAGCGGAPERVGSGRTPQPSVTAPSEDAAVPSEDTAGPATPGGEPAVRVDRPRTLVEGLAVPWGIAFLPGGDALVTERDTARLLRVTGDGEVREIGTIEGVVPGGEGGLMGVAVSPDYERDGLVFLYLTAESDNRIVRYRLDGDRLSERRVIVSGIPKAGIHNGGQLAFGPDGHLYASTGERGDPPLAQSRDSLGGKILRVTRDGEPAPGNPFAGSPVWSYGHRNVQGMAWDDAGRMFASEFGQNDFDEINLIRKGANHGWPEVEGVGGEDRFVDPLVTWSTDEASPSGLAYAGGSLWAAALRGERLWQVPVNGDGGLGTPVAHFEGEYGRLRAVVRAPDGSLWLGTSNKDGRGSPAGADDRILVLPAG